MKKNIYLIVLIAMFLVNCNDSGSSNAMKAKKVVNVNNTEKSSVNNWYII